jgi:hypothetical protein
MVSCSKTVHDARMKQGNPRDVSFRVLRLACEKLLDDLQRVERSASPAKRARITALRKVVRDLVRMSPCGDSMIRVF